MAGCTGALVIAEATNRENGDVTEVCPRTADENLFSVVVAGQVDAARRQRSPAVSAIAAAAICAGSRVIP